MPFVDSVINENQSITVLSRPTAFIDVDLEGQPKLPGHVTPITEKHLLLSVITTFPQNIVVPPNTFDKSTSVTEFTGGGKFLNPPK